MLKIGFVGPQGAGKTTIFKLLASQPNIPPAIKPLIGTVNIIDTRLDFLASIFKPQKLTYAKLELNDIPGFTKSTLALLQPMDTLVYIIPDFGEFKESVRYLSTLQNELIIKDIEMCENATTKARDQRGVDNTTGIELLNKCKSSLEQSIPLRKLELTSIEEKSVRGFGFLSQKPAFIILNTEKPLQDIKSSPLLPENNDLPILPINAKLELEILELEAAERTTYCAEYGITKPAIERFIEIAYLHLKLITFFTVVGSEVRAWQINNGFTVVQAAGKVHSDMEKGFIKADIIGFEEFKQVGSFKTAKEKGLLQTVNREHFVKDGDIIEFKFH